MTNEESNPGNELRPHPKGLELAKIQGIDIKCPECDKSNYPNAKYCNWCGKKVV
jgi:uncharacterized OB-fold protein